MALKTPNSQLGRGGARVAEDIKDHLVELQGLTWSPVAGAAAGTKMAVAAMRKADTLAIVWNVTDHTNDTANCTIQDTHAFGTVTCAAAVNADTVTVNGQVYTIKTTPGAAYTDVAVGGTDTLMATNLKNAINLFEGARTTGAQVVAASASGVVTITAVVDGTAGNAITLASSNGTRLAVTGAGTLTNGTATGGIKSTTNLATKNVMVVWYNKDGV